MAKVAFGNQRVEPKEKTRRVGEVFSRVARRYDLMNDLMSAGQHRLWKDRFVRRIRPRPGESLLDMAGGTGDIAFRLARAGATVTVADINPEMLAIGRKRAQRRGIEGLGWAQSDAGALDFKTDTFDGYVVAFGLRNVTDLEGTLREARRVIRPGGRFYCLEFSQTRWPGFADLYRAYSRNVLPWLGGKVAGDKASYRYLVESIENFPDVDAFRRLIAEAGFARTGVEPILGGLVAIHSGWKV